ncbi:MAG: helix-turn-helix domain-containing protein [Pirellulales bacterium]|nr:helix-turn-helix domain-containing protein [Pirellulales bacterium]
MANRLTMAQIDTIVTLHKSGHSNRRIAQLTGIHRETVGKYERLFARFVAPIPNGEIAP